MRFEELDQRMRRYETALDQEIMPSIFVVARLDGRSFTRLTRELEQFDAPFDERFRDVMVHTTQHLMTCGFNVVFGFTQSDEISLLIQPVEELFKRRLRKWLTILSGEASAAFSLRLGRVASFDNRLCLLPTLEILTDYFRWRSEDAGRNALNGHCYWLLRKQGKKAHEAQSHLNGMPKGEKHELLFSLGRINYNDLPSWQKRGIGVCWEGVEKTGINPKSGLVNKVIRPQLSIKTELPRGDGWTDFLQKIVMDKVVFQPSER